MADMTNKGRHVLQVVSDVLSRAYDANRLLQLLDDNADRLAKVGII